MLIIRVSAHPIIRIIAGSLKSAAQVVCFGSVRGYLSEISFNDEQCSFAPLLCPPLIQNHIEPK